MRGLPDLGDRVFALRVGAEGSLTAKLPERRPVLVLEAKGRLVLASKHGSAAFLQAPPKALVVASTLEAYLRAVREALRLHCKAAETRRVAFLHLASLAERLSEAVA